jgi:hypothetical protein
MLSFYCARGIDRSDGLASFLVQFAILGGGEIFRTIQIENDQWVWSIKFLVWSKDFSNAFCVIDGDLIGGNLNEWTVLFVERIDEFLMSIYRRCQLGWDASPRRILLLRISCHRSNQLVIFARKGPG